MQQGGGFTVEQLNNIPNNQALNAGLVRSFLSVLTWFHQVKFDTLHYFHV